MDCNLTVHDQHKAATLFSMNLEKSCRETKCFYQENRNNDNSIFLRSTMCFLTNG